MKRKLTPEQEAARDARRLKFKALWKQVSMMPPIERQPKSYDRDEAIKLIRAALKRRSGKAWSVTGGRGTAWGWIKIDAPPSRATWSHRLIAAAPELLTFAYFVAAWLTAPELNRTTLDAVQRQARAAIAKATGTKTP